MTSSTPAPARDNLLGVCAAIGDVTGLPVLPIRLAFVAALFLSFGITLLAYGIAGIAVRLADRPLLPWAWHRRPALRH